MKIEIGAYEAKTKLPELLREVQAGKRFTITNRGKAVAELVPVSEEKPMDVSKAIADFLAYKTANPIRHTFTAAEIKAMISEGRE